MSKVWKRIPKWIPHNKLANCRIVGAAAEVVFRPLWLAGLKLPFKTISLVDCTWPRTWGYKTLEARLKSDFKLIQSRKRNLMKAIWGDVKRLDDDLTETSVPGQARQPWAGPAAAAAAACSDLEEGEWQCGEHVGLLQHLCKICPHTWERKSYLVHRN